MISYIFILFHIVFEYPKQQTRFNALELRSQVAESIQILKRIRHPNIIQYLEDETREQEIVLITDHVVTLKSYLRELKNVDQESTNDIICWGILNIFKVLNFLKKSCDIDYLITLDSVFVNDRQEWQLGSFENAVNSYKSLILSRYSNIIRPKHLSKDHEMFVIFMYQVFNDDLNVTNIKNIPQFIRSAYRSLLSDNEERVKILNFQNCPCFSTDFIAFMDKITNIQILEMEEITQVLKQNEQLIVKLPVSFQYKNILFYLINKYKFGRISPEHITPCLSIIKMIPPDAKATSYVISFVESLYKSKDRNIKSFALDNHKHLSRFMDSKTINEVVFPSIISSVTDPSPYVRESALKSIVLTAPHLSGANIKKLLPHLAKSQMDTHPLLRANTNVCIGKVIRNLIDCQIYTSRQPYSCFTERPER
ncbi:putative inactive serine/threonine-protein kinase scy1 [Thelohanellus kitauei]|uniref:Putative inactive serine/threonine-protein kinase scy1 n=1 Tax=Thelohanellus kitauei TaxID=669202 RepID=A0A0C2MSN2_THEKT|nr:putative inactive serine/threonine-protein kinase scy1 [Thelohanellus kitauei]